MTSAASPYAERVAILLDRLSRLARELQYRSDLNPAQWEAMRYLARANRYSRSPSALAEFLGTTKGTVSQTLISLENKGFILRTRIARDRRQVDLQITPAGRRMLENDPIATIREAAEQLINEGGVEAIGAPMIKGLARLLHDVQVRHGVKEFGTCSDCTLFCVEKASAQAPTNRCGLTGDELAANETTRICVNFHRAETPGEIAAVGTK